MPMADKTPGLLRRLGAMLYDALLLLALLMLATALLMPISYGAIAMDNIAYQLYLLSVVTGYFVYFWLRHGQTLGMRTWKIRLVRADGQALKLGDTLRRLFFSVLSWLPLGLGFWWILFTRQRLAWHDRWSGTLLVRVMRPAKERPD